MNRQDACSTIEQFSCGTGILPVLQNSARCELQPADPLKNPVSLILVHHTKSDCNTSFIIESASTHILCVDAISTAKPDQGRGFVTLNYAERPAPVAAPI